jgi:soluble lytic murein transglycosylase-like protein
MGCWWRKVVKQTIGADAFKKRAWVFLDAICKRLRRLSSCRLQLTAAMAAGVFFLIGSKPLIGEDYQREAVKEHRLSNIRTAIELQQTGMSTASRDRLAESIADTTGRHSLDPMLVLAVIRVESRFDHKAVSSAGAQGLMQVQPHVVTALVERGKMLPSRKGIQDPGVNVEVGVSYLAYLKEMFGDWKLALTAYNSGPSLVARKIAAKEKLSFEYARRVFSAQRELRQQLASLTKASFENAEG